MDFPKPLIAAVNGPAEGISITIMGLFGLIYAWDKATFHTPFMELGQSPEGCSSFMFPRIMGPAKVHRLASNFCWNLCISCWVEEHILSYCFNLWNYTVNSFSLVEWNVAFWMQTDSSWSKRLWIGCRFFSPMTSSQKKFRTEYKQWPSYPPPQDRKLNCRISQQRALYNGVAVAFGDMLDMLSKQLICDSFCDLLHGANEKEFTLLEERWLSEECMQAIMAFMQRKSKL